MNNECTEHIWEIVDQLSSYVIICECENCEERKIFAIKEICAK